MIVALIFLGQVLEIKARERTGAAIKALLRLAPDTACRISPDGTERDVPVENILEGDRVRVKPGDRVPVDGLVLEGRSQVDESMITGEPVPVEKAQGDRVTAGATNGRGTFVFQADKVGDETMLARIVQLVAAAQRSRAPIQGLADKVAAWFVPLVVLAALMAFAAWAIVGPEPRLVYALVSAVSVLIIACPCALGLATPMSIMTATGRGAQSGILIRDAEALEKLSAVDVLIVDKTGTLTVGKPVLTDILVLGEIAENELLRLTATLEKGSEHPLAEAVVSYAVENGMALGELQDFETVTGMGARGVVDGRLVSFGNAAMMKKMGIDPTDAERHASRFREDGKTVITVAVDNVIAGLVAVADPIKPSSHAALRTLCDSGLSVIMATGDNERTARAVASKLDIASVHAGLLPADKLDLIRTLQSQGKTVAMAGDGVNDAPALAAADVGVAMGTGADVAIESAGITLVKGNLEALVRARVLAQATLRNIKQNLVFAFGYNAIGVPVAAGALFPLTGLLLSPMIAAAAMSLSSVSVISNALRLKTLKLP